MIKLTKDEEVFHLTLDNGENRWNTNLVREISSVIDEIEASKGPAALVTSSSDPKFFSNGLDLDWIKSAPSDDRSAFTTEFMTLMGRIISLSVPSICVVNGHAFGAGFMLALAHDVRYMRKDRGFMCANEIEIGMIIPDPEIALFKHKLPANVFFETVQLARRWTGPDAKDAGIVSDTFEIEDLLPEAIKQAKTLSRLGANRKVYGGMKDRLFGKSPPNNNLHGAAHLLKENYK